MTDFSKSKYATGSKAGEIYPQNAIDTAGWDRLEPLIDAATLRRRHLFGIPLVSWIPHPVTKKRSEITDEDIKGLILVAVSKVEMLTGTIIFPVSFKEKYPFDRNQYESFGYMMTKNRPVSSIESLTVTPSNGVDVFTVPLEWVETAYLIRGQINIIPMTISTPDMNGLVVNSQAGGGAAFLSFMSYKHWIPAFWQISYTCGYKDGMLPRVLNYLIGIVAAIDILAMLAASAGLATSASLGIDGLSQSTSGPGPQVYDTLVNKLSQERDAYIKKIKNLSGLKVFSSNV